MPLAARRGYGILLFAMKSPSVKPANDMDCAEHPRRAIQSGRARDSWWLRTGVMVLMVFMISGTLAAQTLPDEPAQDRPLRFDLTPLIGYRTSISFPTGNSGADSTEDATFDAKPSYGFAFGMRLDEQDLVEFRWARQDSSVHLAGVSTPSVSVVLNQFHGDFTHEYILEDSNRWRSWARPFVMGSVGATRISGGGNSFTRFSFGLGGGVKVYFSRHLGLRVQAEWLPIVVSPEVGSFVCGGGCTVSLSATAASQGEIVAGPIFRF